MLRILDALCRPAREGAVNEDALGSASHAAWVIDGATGVHDRPLTAGPTDAAWLARQLAAALGEAFAAGPASADAALAAAAARLSRHYLAERSGSAQAGDEPSACFVLAAAAPADGMLSLYGLGDCRILVERPDGSTAGFGGSPALVRLEAALIAAAGRLRRAGLAGDALWQALRTEIRAARAALMNRPGGYWVVHPTLPWLDRVERRVVPAADVRRILLMSDGFSRLVETFGRYSEAALLAAARQRGLAALHDELRALEEADSDCTCAPRIKPRDDATALLAAIV